MTKTLPGHPNPDTDNVKGRIITLEFEKYYLVGTYVPNAGEKLKVRGAVTRMLGQYLIHVQNLDARATWNRHFEAYIRDLDGKKPVIWTGDLNVAPTAIGMCCASLPQLYALMTLY